MYVNTYTENGRNFMEKKKNLFSRRLSDYNDNISIIIARCCRVAGLIPQNKRDRLKTYIGLKKIIKNRTYRRGFRS